MGRRKPRGRQVYEARCRFHDDLQEHKRRVEEAKRKYDQSMILYIGQKADCKKRGLSKEATEVETRQQRSTCELLRKELERAKDKLAQYEFLHAR